MASLVVRLGGREVERFEVLRTKVTVGRDPANDLVIENSSVSRFHAVVRFKNGNFTIEDAGSRNGITVNQRETKQMSLRWGDKIGLGKFELEFVSVGGVSERQLIRVAELEPPQATDIQETFAVKMNTLQAAAVVKKPAAPVAVESPPETPKGTIVAIAALCVVMVVVFAMFFLTT